LVEAAMAEKDQATTPKGLWTVVVLPPIILAIQMQLNFVLVRQACSAQRNLALYGVTIVAFVLIVITAIVTIGIWRRAGAAWVEDEVDLGTRIRFVSLLGILSSAMSILVVIAQGIATIQFNPCQP